MLQEHVSCSLVVRSQEHVYPLSTVARLRFAGGGGEERDREREAMESCCAEFAWQGKIPAVQEPWQTRVPAMKAAGTGKTKEAARSATMTPGFR